MEVSYVFVVFSESNRSGYSKAFYWISQVLFVLAPFDFMSNSVLEE